ncbi:class I SAM-dependent methyltransferase [bacterium]|nr:class I SAM-dependent methyltransferase [bacterium]
MRIKDEIVDINENLTSKFWENRAKKGLTLKTVLLNEELEDDILYKRNLKELNIVKSILPQEPQILDIGCGFGRWAENLKDEITYYQGIDYAESLINIAQKRFKQNNNINFVKMSISKLDEKQLLSSYYNMAIVTGVLMYINDKDIFEILDFINTYITDTIYIQESISKNSRLTLDNIYSENLNDNYSAIYRTKDEYEKFFIYKLNNFTIKTSDLLLDEDMTSHKETNARYWVLKRIQK